MMRARRRVITAAVVRDTLQPVTTSPAHPRLATASARLRVRDRVVVGMCALMVLASACTRDGDAPNAASTAPVSDAPAATVVPATTEVLPSPRPVVEVPIRLVTTVDDAEDFAGFTAAVLDDPRGWRRAGFTFRFRDDAPYTVVLAEGAQVDRLCHPYDTGGEYSCQIGSVVALNAERWRSATSTWPGSLAEYRTMLVNHEVGHLLGQHHPEQKCTRRGRRAAVMAQQSARLDGCAPNPWPLPWEIQCAARHEEPLAPGYESSPAPLCGPADVRR